VVFAEHFQNVNLAIAFEKQVKGWRRKKNWAWINGRWDLLPEELLSNNRSKDRML